MNNPNINEELLLTTIGTALNNFYYSFVSQLDALTIKTVIVKKNTYLFRLKNIQGVAQIVGAMLSTYVSTVEELNFGNHFETLVIAAIPKTDAELAGQDLWEEITGDSDFYLKLIHYIDRLPKTHIDAFEAAYQKAENRLIKEFTQLYCRDDGSIDWDALVIFNSDRS